jgi:hypothetical protein
METNDNINSSLLRNAAIRALAARERARINPNPGTISNATLKTLDFRRMAAKRRAARGRTDLTGAAKRSSESKRLRKFIDADKARRAHYFDKHGF